MSVKELKHAYHLLQSRKFHEVLRLLEPQTFRFRESHTFYYYLGLACINTNDIAGAATYLKRASHLNPGSVNSMIGLAYVHLRRNEVSEAIGQYLKVLELEPSNKVARQGLELLKRSADSDDYVDFADTTKINGLMPRIKRAFPVLLVILPPIAIILAFAVIFFLPRMPDRGIGKKKDRLGDSTVLVLPAAGSLTDGTGAVEYVLTEKQIQQSFALALTSFNKFDDNIARREINRLLLSNAAEPVKEKARIMESYLKPPDFLSYKGNIAYAEIIKNPGLYRSCYVRWKGLIGNLAVGDKKINFDFLVGYQDKKVLEGVVPVSLSFGVDLRDGDAVEIIGEVTEINPLSLEAIAIRPIQP